MIFNAWGYYSLNKPPGNVLLSITATKLGVVLGYAVHFIERVWKV